MIWISMTVLGIASTSREAEVEEDTRKVEAVGWLISQASDEETLHCALACIPSVANTPLRRQILMELTRQTLALLLHTIVAAPEQQCMIGTSRARIIRAPRDDGGLDRESRLMFYVTCLAEVSQAPVLKQEPGWILFGFQRNRWVSFVVQSWLYNNWHRFLTIPPAQETFTRGLRFYHHWYSWLRPITPDQLQVDLGTLSKHPNIHLRAAAKAALCQLFPSSLSILDISSWPSPPLGSFGLANARAYRTMLVEVRMVTFRAIDAYQYSRTLNTSVLRYLQWYCDAILRLWTSNIEYQKGSIFEVLMVLGYVIIENHSDVVDVTRFGCATPMKAARCIMALKRLHDCSTECDTMLEMDRHLHSSLAFSMVAAVAKYLQIAVTLMERGHPPIISEEGIEVDEDSITTGMKYLENALLQLAEQDWPEEVPPQIILALEAIYLINKHYQVKLLSLDAHYNPAPLIERLKYRAASCDTVSERISAVWTASRILNKMPDPSSAWLVAIKHPWSLLATIQSMAQEGSPDSHLAALSTLLDTPIFRPEAINVGKMHVSNFGSSGPHFASSNLPDATVLNILPTQTVKLKRLYVDIFNDTSQLTQVISNLSSSQGADIISKSLTLLSALIHHLHPNYSPSSFFEAEKYPKILTSIASHNDLELIPTPIRKSAIELFFRVWQYRFQNIAKADGHQNTRVKEAFGCNLYISEIGESINLLADRHTTIALDSILLFTEQLEATYNFIPAHTRAAWRNLVDSLKNAVIWADFGRAGEDEREQAFTRLAMLQKCLSISRNH
ncbi:hypothetical protein FRC02_001907 [Tulasnella sp. 418]|nr:hypothetical protein FRC02_001907 [Tulasnella sp. 418]